MDNNLSNDIVLSNKAQSNQPSLEPFGKHFSEKLLQAMISDRRFAEQISEVFKPDYFELNYLKYLSTKYFDYENKYNDFPSLALLLTIVRDDLKNDADQLLKNQIVDYIQRIRSNPEPFDLPFVKEKALEFCRKQALKEGLEDVIELIAVEKYEEIVDRVKKAVYIGTDNNLGHDFFNDVEKRFVQDFRNPINVGIPELDNKEYLDGGIGCGELMLIISSSGTGKSHFLVQTGANSVKCGKNVLHFTFELSEKITGKRYDSHLCNIPFNDLNKHKEEVLEYYKNNNRLGQLQIKEYPSGTTTINTLKAYYEKLQITKGFTPDLIIIDYIDKMRSTKSYDLLRLELGLITEEVRSWASELKIPILSASQSGRASFDKDVISLADISESINKIQTADIVISLSRKEAEKFSGTGRLTLLKNRAGKDGITINVIIDTSRSKFEVDTAPTVLDVIDNDDKLRQSLKRKWDELNNDN